MTPSDFNRRRKRFAAWLVERGATMLAPIDKKRDLLRWAGGGKVSYVHRGKGDRLYFMGLAEAAWTAFLAKAAWAFPPVAGEAAELPAGETPAPKAEPRKRKPSRPRPPYPLQKTARDGVVRVAGIYRMPAEAYHADPCPEPSLSNSGARLLHQMCPAIFWHRRLDPPVPSRAQSLGTAAHTWILEGEAFERRYVTLSPHHSNRSAIGRATVERIEAEGRTAIAAADWHTIRAMREAIEAHPFAANAFRGGRPEMSLFWQDAYLGVWCRARPDYLPDRGPIIVDYMTARSVHPEDLRKALVTYGYDQKGDWLIRGARALGLIERPSVAYVIQQSDPPYPVVVARLTPATLTGGRMKNDRALALFARCLRTGTWPGYGDEDVVELDLPEWEHRRLQADSEAGHFDVARILRGVRLTPPATDTTAADQRAAEVAATP
ncbi:hypothetical protein STAQ_28140 [Allostella sp. ATCC 35155]|nr:hypothetical protein STAQ_28140 [Stella sp. ATCC 35155]